jgi:hypothetical protein
MRVVVLERDGQQVIFEEAVKKRFVYYYDLVDAMSERASACPRASMNTITMAPSSSSSSLEDDEDDPPPATTRGAKEDVEEDVA